MPLSQIYERIHQMAPAFAHATRQAVEQAHNEAEFERLMNNEIERAARVLGTQLLFRQQYTPATGRADAVYNRLVIEYEPPGSLRENLRHGHTAHAVQHAQAKRIVIRVRREGKELHVSVEDDGVGFTLPARPDVLTQAGHFGLVGMRERAVRLGGSLRVESAPQQGTRVVVRLPL